MSSLLKNNQQQEQLQNPTIDLLINPVFMKSSSMSTNSKCEKCAVHFRDKIDTIRLNLYQCQPMNLNTPEPGFYARKHWRNVS